MFIHQIASLEPTLKSDKTDTRFICIFKINPDNPENMNLAENLKRFFKAKETGQTDAKAPEGVCPNCWGRQEWDGEYYKVIKARNITPESNTYNNFINEVAMKLDKITLNEDTYQCSTCKMKTK